MPGMYSDLRAAEFWPNRVLLTYSAELRHQATSFRRPQGEAQETLQTLCSRTYSHSYQGASRFRCTTVI